MWSKKSKDFYKDGGESASGSDDERDERMEARELQKARAKTLRAMDYELDFVEEDISKSIDKDISEELVSLSDSLLSKEKSLPTIAQSDLTDSADLSKMLSETTKKISELKDRLIPFLTTIRENKSNELTAKGISYLEMKIEILLSYLALVSLYICLKTRGVTMKDHPILEKITRTKLLLEKISTLDNKMNQHINNIIHNKNDNEEGQIMAGKLLAMSDDEEGDFDLQGMLQEGGDDDEMDSSLEDDEEAMEEEEDEEEEEEVDVKKYKAPKRMAVEYTKDYMRREEREKKDDEKKKNRLRNSEMVRSLMSEYSIAPEQVGMEGNAYYDKKALDKMKSAQELENFEQDTFSRVRMTKKQKLEDKRNNANAKKFSIAVGSGELIDDIENTADSIIHQSMTAGKKGSAGGKNNALGFFLNTTKQATQAGKKLSNNLLGGTEKLPLLKDAPKRKRMEEEGEDEGVMEAIRRRQDKETVRKTEMKARAVGKYLPKLRKEEEDSAERRKTNYQINKNKGLTRVRDKQAGNSRVANRKKYEKTVQKRKGAVQDMKFNSSSNRYDGEAYGLRTHVVKSTKIK